MVLWWLMMLSLAAQGTPQPAARGQRRHWTAADGRYATLAMRVWRCRLARGVLGRGGGLDSHCGGGWPALLGTPRRAPAATPYRRDA
jgi:hypothetical protein